MEVYFAKFYNFIKVCTIFTLVALRPFQYGSQIRKMALVYSLCHIIKKMIYAITFRFEGLRSSLAIEKCVLDNLVNSFHMASDIVT